MLAHKLRRAALAKAISLSITYTYSLNTATFVRSQPGLYVYSVNLVTFVKEV